MVHCCNNTQFPAFKKMLRLLSVTLFLPIIVSAAPGGVAKSASASFAASGSFEDSGSKPLLSFENGAVGVNFGGYHASAGLGGLLTGNLADGGLHAEAGTPHGQSAGAGLGGAVDASGNRFGLLYSHASDGVSPLRSIFASRRTKIETMD